MVELRAFEAGCRGFESRSRSISLPIGSATLAGDLTLPHASIGVVLFAHGSGSSRLSPRNRHVAQQLNQRSLATLLIDLLTPDEEKVDGYTLQLRFDIGLLADRLTACADWLAAEPSHGRLTAWPIWREHRRRGGIDLRGPPP